MEEPSVVRLRDQERETAREDSIFDDDRSLPRDPDSSIAHLLVPPRPQSQRFRSHVVQAPESQQSHASRPWQFAWWLLTLILSAFICVAIKIYQSGGPFTSGHKHTFNAITTALILILGLNFFEAFKSVAKGSRSRILKLDSYNPRERELIFNIENLTGVIVLGWKSSRKAWAKPWTTLLCIAWITINVLAQISVAMISLTYSVVDGTNWNGTYTIPGVANAPNLTCYSIGPHGHCGEDVTNQARAHANGEVALAFPCAPYNDPSQILESKDDHRYYCRKVPNRQEFAYRFNEYNPNDTQQSYPRFTNRTITASSGVCFQYQMVGKPRDGSDGNVDYEYTNGTIHGNITIPGQSTAFEGTTYIYQGINTPQEAVKYACGPRCIWMWVYKSRGPAPGQKSVFYQCPITVNPVNNATKDTQEVSDDMARIAAASIALQGRPSYNTWKQYQLYTLGLHWEVHFKEPDEIGADMAEFAIASISTMATRNPPIPVDGLVPYLGSQVEVKWYYLIPLLAGISGAHLALFLLNIYAT